MDPRLQKLIDESNVLTDAVRMRLRAEGDNLAPEQIEQVLKLVGDAEAEYGQIQADLTAKKKEINQDYLEKVDNYIRHEIPKGMKKIEEADRKDEESTLESVLSELDNL